MNQHNDNNPFDRTVSPEAAAGDGAAAAAAGEAAEAGGSAGQEEGAGSLPSPQDEASGPRAGGGAAGGHEHPEAGAHAAHRRETGSCSAEGKMDSLRPPLKIILSTVSAGRERKKKQNIVYTYIIYCLMSYRQNMKNRV